MSFSEHGQSDQSTIQDIITPAETIVDNETATLDFKQSQSTFPLPGHIVSIRSASCGRFITLLDGQVTLAHADTRGSTHWLCVENKGWLGFRNVVSGKFLGYDKRRQICCLAQRQLEWENFCVRPNADGGYILLMTNWDALWHVGVEMVAGKEKLAKLAEGAEGGTVWEFWEVHLENTG